MLSRPKVQYIANATVIIDVPGMRMLCDPWLTDGAFEGSWFHFPPVQSKLSDLQPISHVYVSHIHPDHFDPDTLHALPRSTPIVLCQFEQPWLRRQIEALGFDVIELPPGEPVEVVPGVRVWAFSAFTQNPLSSSQIPNVIDSAIVVENGEWAIFNANDNTPNDAACRILRAQFGRFDLAMLPYSGASEYPSCFANLSDHDKMLAADRKIAAYLARMVDNINLLEPKTVMPFAGQYILGGPLHVKNPYLGVPSLERAVAKVEDTGHHGIGVREGDIVDVLSGEVTHTLPESNVRLPDYEEAIRDHVYWYLDAFRLIDPGRRTNLTPLVSASRERLWRYQERFGWFKSYRVLIRTVDEPQSAFLLDFALREARAVPADTVPSPPYLIVELPYALLLAILTRHANFNNAAIGCHIEFFREPEAYQPEVFMLLAFLQV